MPVPHAGELAALGTASCWTVSSLAFEAAGRRIGSLSLNLVRLVIAFAFLTVANGIVRGVPLPVDASAHAWVWLAVSGLVGFVFGDVCLFKAFVMIGPRLSLLMMSLAPPLAAVLGWSILGERLSGLDLLGMALTVSGIAWAATARRPAPANGGAGERHPVQGLLLGFGGALGQAGGLVLSKLGMGGYDPFAATQVRVVAGIAGYAALFFLLGWWGRARAAVRDRRALGFATLGSFFGPFLGVTLSLFAVQRTASGVAASIMAISPILILPAVVLLRRERVGLAGVGGAVLAVAGVMVLFL